MNQNANSLVLTSLSIPQLRDIFRDEIESYFNKNPVNLGDNREDILGIEEAAEYIKLAIPTIHVLSSKKQIPVIKKGKKLLFSKTDLTAWLMQGRKLTLSEIQKDAERLVPIL